LNSKRRLTATAKVLEIAPDLFCFTGENAAGYDSIKRSLERKGSDWG